MNDLLINAVFNSYCHGDFKAVGLSPEDDPTVSRTVEFLATEFGLNKKQELKLSDLVDDAAGAADYNSFRCGLIIGAALEQFLHGEAKILQSIAKTSPESV